MSEKQALQRAADEARKAARTAREFAGILDDYAKYLMQPLMHARADGLRHSALNKSSIVEDVLAASDKWVGESLKSAAAQPAQQAIGKHGSTDQERLPEEVKPFAVRVRKAGKR